MFRAFFRSSNTPILKPFEWLIDHPELHLGGTRQALPQRDGTDGAFAACLSL